MEARLLGRTRHTARVHSFPFRVPSRLTRPRSPGAPGVSPDHAMRAGPRGRRGDPPQAGHRVIDSRVHCPRPPRVGGQGRAM